MKQLTFHNGNKIPVLGLGTWKSKPGEVYTVVKKAIEVGYRHFDCARAYENQEEIGEAFSESFQAGIVKREDLFVTSKLWNNRHKLDQVGAALDETLQQLQLDYLDLYLIHWPVAHKPDIKFPQKADEMLNLSEVPLSETWTGMIAQEKSGKTINIGVSNFSISNLEKIETETGVRPVMNQVEMHPYLQQKDLKAYCDEKEIIMTAYCPLGSSDRPENRRQASDPRLLDEKVVHDIANNKGVSAAQVLLAWAINRNTVVIPKTVKEHRLKENLASAEIELTSEEMQLIDSISYEFRYIKGDFWCLEGTDYTLGRLWG